MKPLDLASLFPSFVVVECCPIEEDVDYSLFPEEERAVERAVAKRRREFGAGRVCARHALGRLGVDPVPLIRGDDGVTGWPAGIAGSISHCHTLCAVALARTGDARGIGLDVEELGRMKPAMARLIATDRERAWSAARSDRAPEDWYTMIFSAKESVYKCLYPLLRRWIGYHDAEIRIETQRREFGVEVNLEPDQDGASGRSPSRYTLQGRYLFLRQGLVATGIVLGSRTPL